MSMLKGPEIKRIAAVKYLNHFEDGVLDQATHRGYPYIENGEQRVGTVTRYAKNYTDGDYKFCLVCVTDNETDEGVEARFDKAASKLTVKDKKNIGPALMWL